MLAKSRQVQSSNSRAQGCTARKTKRSSASVKHEIDLLSRIFTLAVTWGLADSNPDSVAIGTGARKSEQLILRVRQCDFFRNLILFDKTKSNRARFVEMNSEVKGILLPLCRGKLPDDYVWLSPKTGKPFDDIKKGFISACEDAGIEGLVWHDLRATYGTRLGEAGLMHTT